MVSELYKEKIYKPNNIILFNLKSLFDSEMKHSQLELPNWILLTLM
jgi:hypothetical protein